MPQNRSISSSRAWLQSNIVVHPGLLHGFSQLGMYLCCLPVFESSQNSSGAQWPIHSASFQTRTAIPALQAAAATLSGLVRPSVFGMPTTLICFQIFWQFRHLQTKIPNFCELFEKLPGQHIPVIRNPPVRSPCSSRRLTGNSVELTRRKDDVFLWLLYLHVDAQLVAFRNFSTWVPNFRKRVSKLVVHCRELELV